MYKLTLEWMEGTQNRSQTISREQQTKMSGIIRIGRDPEQCDVVVRDPTNQISRLHLEIFFDQKLNTLCVRNATWTQQQANVVVLDEKLVIEEDVPLQSGSVIQLRHIQLKVTKLELDQPTIIPNHQSPPPQQHQFTQPAFIPNQSPAPVSSEIKMGSSILQRACQDDFDAIEIMFRQFIPEDEQIHFARYLGIKGLWGFGTREFACVTDRRVADITVGRFSEVTYQDGYLEHIHSAAIYQPSKLRLYLSLGFLALTLTLISQWLFQNWWGLVLLPLLLPFVVKQYYRVVKCGLVLTVRESEVLFTTIGTYAFSESLIYIFINRKLITRANALYRSFIIQREVRLDSVEKYPLPT